MIQVAQAICQRDLIRDLPRRSIRHVQESDVVGVAMTGAAFDDIRSRGNCRPTDLGRQTELLLARERSRVLVHENGQLVGQLEGPQFRVISHRRLDSPTVRIPPVSSLQPPAYFSLTKSIHPFCISSNVW